MDSIGYNGMIEWNGMEWNGINWIMNRMDNIDEWMDNGYGLIDEWN